MYALACVLIWSFIPIVSRLGQAGMDSFQFLFWSNLISAISVVIVALGSGYKVSKLFILPRNTIKKVFILGFGLFVLLTIVLRLFHRKWNCSLSYSVQLAINYYFAVSGIIKG